ncbi:MAG: hypothetical protein IJD50_02835 [Clostridia bacterium]|nr:hypothetical protein [Clostridia bacterium]
MSKIKFLTKAVVNEENDRVTKKLFVKDVMGKNIELVADTDYQPNRL